MAAVPETKEEHRIVFHVDVNSAFLSWSALKRLQEDPESTDLRTIPSAVGGDVETRHGIITAKSIPAKKYGIQTGEPVVSALRKCPQLVLVRSDFKTYREYSKQFIGILREYTDLVQQVSIDEAFMDVTDMQDLLGNGDRGYLSQLAESIRNDISRRLGFTVNVGISVNRFLAKMASDFEKPDKTHTLFPEEIPSKLWPLPIRDMFGCGRATAEKLNLLGFWTIGEVAACDEALLKTILGDKHGIYVHERANGRDDSPVVPERQDAKSYSNELTTPEDIDRHNYNETALPLLQELSGKVSKRLAKDGMRGSTIFVMVKTGKFQRHSRQVTVNQPTNEQAEIERTAGELLGRLLLSKDGLFSKGEVIRLIGVGVTGLEESGTHQMGLEEWLQINEKQLEKKEKLDQMMKQIRERYGDDSVRKGGTGIEKKSFENNTFGKNV